MNALIVTPSELTISMIHTGLAVYQGTRAMLEAEGIIPANIEWPDGYDELQWDDGSFRYAIKRKRPDGEKGPRKLFATVDWWSLRQKFIEESLITQEVKRRKQELAKYIYRNSSKGMAEGYRQFNAYIKAREDEKFQAFKALIPVLIEAKRARRPKSSREPQGASA